MSLHRNNFRTRGLALILVLGVVAIAAVLGVAILSGAALESQSKGNTASAAEAQYLAESGVNVAIYYLQHPEYAPALSNNVYAGQNGVTFGATVPGSVDVAIEDQGSSNYQITATASAGASAANQFTRSLKTTVYVDNAFVVKNAAIFAADFTVPDCMTINGGVLSDGIVTKSDAAVINGAIVAMGSNVTGWIARPDYPAKSVPAIGEVNLYISASGASPYYTYRDGDGNLQTGTPTLVSGTFGGNYKMSFATIMNPLLIYYATNNVTISDCTMHGTIVICGAGHRATISGTSTIFPLSGMPALIVPGDLQFTSDSNPKSLVINGLCYLGGNIGTTGGTASSCNLDIEGALMMGSATPQVSANLSGTITVNYVSANVQVPLFTSINNTPQSVKIIHWGS